MAGESLSAIHPRSYRWLDVLWLVFLGGLALLDPLEELHKQLILLAFGILQWMESTLVGWNPRRGPAYSVLVKILLATLLLDHTSTFGINSSYYPIYYLPVTTAALYFGPIGTLLWTTLAAGTYCAFLIPAIFMYQLMLTPGDLTELGLRIVFFYLAALVVNRIVFERRELTAQYRTLAATLTETNQRLEQAQAEARRSERLAALGQLSAGLAHEIRNPLGIIKGSAEMLNRKLEAADPLSSELAGYISGEVSRLNGLVARFLDFARPLHMERRPTEIAPILERALRSAHELHPAARVRVQRDFALGTPQVPIDEAMAEQAFLNLALNAYEAMGEAGGTLRVSAGPAKIEGCPGVAVEFHDSGPGIPPEMREQIFNPFVTTKKTGVGLGLSIVAKIMDEHGGTARLEPATGGACFRLFFPAAAPGAREPADSRDAAAAPARPVQA